MKTTKRCIAMLLSALMVLTVVPAVTISAVAPVSVSVANGQNGVPVTASFVLTYADVASTDGVAITTADGAAVAASITANGTEVTINPTDNLAAKAQYKITADGTDISFYTSDGTEYSAFADFEEAKTGSDLYSYIVASGFQPGNMYVTENGGAGAGAMEIKSTTYPEATKALVDAGNAVIKAADGKFVLSAKPGYQANMEFRWPNGVTPKSIVKIDFDISTPSFKEPTPTYTYLYDFLKLRNSSAAYERYALMDWGWRLAPVAAVSGVGANAAIQQSNPSDNNTRYYLYNNNSAGAQKHITMIADLEAGTTKLYSDGAYVGTTYEVADAKGTTFSRILLNINALTWTAGEPKALIDNLAFTEVIKPVAEQATDGTVAINFNTPMPAGAVSGATFNGEAVTPVISADGYTLTCEVPAGTQAGTYDLVLPDLTATNTYTLAGTNYSFTVEGVPGGSEGGGGTVAPAPDPSLPLDGTFVKASIANGANGVAVSESIVLTFEEDLTAFGGVALYDASTDTEVVSTITANGKKVTIDPTASLAANTQYKIVTPVTEDILFYTGSDAGYSAFLDFEEDKTFGDVKAYIEANNMSYGQTLVWPKSGLGSHMELHSTASASALQEVFDAGNATLEIKDGKLALGAASGYFTKITINVPESKALTKVDFDIQIPAYSLTYDAWTAGDLPQLVALYTNGAVAQYFGAMDNGASFYNARITSGGGSRYETTDSKMLFSGNTSYEEKHITMVMDSANSKLYVYCDGVLKATKSVSNAFSGIVFGMDLRNVTETAVAPKMYIDNLAYTEVTAPVATPANDGTVTVTFNTPMPAGPVASATFGGRSVTPVISADGYTLTCEVPAGTEAGTYALELPDLVASNTLTLEAANYNFTVEAVPGGSEGGGGGSVTPDPGPGVTPDPGPSTPPASFPESENLLTDQSDWQGLSTVGATFKADGTLQAPGKTSVPSAGEKISYPLGTEYRGDVMIEVDFSLSGKALTTLEFLWLGKGCDACDNAAGGVCDIHSVGLADCANCLASPTGRCATHNVRCDACIAADDGNGENGVERCVDHIDASGATRTGRGPVLYTPTITVATNGDVRPGPYPAGRTSAYVCCNTTEINTTIMDAGTGNSNEFEGETVIYTARIRVNTEEGFSTIGIKKKDSESDFLYVKHDDKIARHKFFGDYIDNINIIPVPTASGVTTYTYVKRVAVSEYVEEEITVNGGNTDIALKDGTGNYVKADMVCVGGIGTGFENIELYAGETLIVSSKIENAPLVAFSDEQNPIVKTEDNNGFYIDFAKLKDLGQLDYSTTYTLKIPEETLKNKAYVPFKGGDVVFYTEHEPLGVTVPDGLLDSNGELIVNEITEDGVQKVEATAAGITLKPGTTSRSLTLIVVLYDGDVMVGVKNKTINLPQGATTTAVDGDPYGLYLKTEKPAGVDSVKAYLWDDLTNMRDILSRQ